MGPANLGPLQFSEPLTAASENECRWYHMFDKPDGSVIRGSWDYRHNVDEYLGHVDFRGKSVLEIVPASGFLTVAGAARRVRIGHRYPRRRCWEYGPGHRDTGRAANVATACPTQKVGGSRSGVHRPRPRFYCGVAGLREVAAQLSFDICLIGGLLQHVRYPVDVLWIASQAATQVIVSERFLPEVEKTGEPLARLVPSRRNDFIDSWWYFSSSAVSNALDIFGFDRERLGRFKCRQWPKVASAGEGAPWNSTTIAQYSRNADPNPCHFILVTAQTTCRASPSSM